MVNLSNKFDLDFFTKSLKSVLTKRSKQFELDYFY